MDRIGTIALWLGIVALLTLALSVLAVRSGSGMKPLETRTSA
ncbi:MAG TPA: hypothetical protein VL261_05405 [Nitrospira sp.]|nr:hypothetical protein [Nitrospira sp.]